MTDLELMVQRCILECLEPIEFKPTYVVQKQLSPVENIVFLMEGKCDVGYNKNFLLRDNDFEDKENQLVSLK